MATEMNDREASVRRSLSALLLLGSMMSYLFGPMWLALGFAWVAWAVLLTVAMR